MDRLSPMHTAFARKAALARPCASRHQHVPVHCALPQAHEVSVNGVGDRMFGRHIPGRFPVLTEYWCAQHMRLDSRHRIFYRGKSGGSVRTVFAL